MNKLLKLATKGVHLYSQFEAFCVLGYVKLLLVKNLAFPHICYVYERIIIIVKHMIVSSQTNFNKSSINLLHQICFQI